MNDKDKRTLQLDVARVYESVTRELYGRLLAGAATYGDASLLTPLPETTHEIRQELLDVLGWSVILIAKMERLDVAAKAMTIRRDALTSEIAQLETKLAMIREEIEHG